MAGKDSFSRARRLVLPLEFAVIDRWLPGEAADAMLSAMSTGAVRLTKTWLRAGIAVSEAGPATSEQFAALTNAMHKVAAALRVPVVQNAIAYVAAAVRHLDNEHTST